MPTFLRETEGRSGAAAGPGPGTAAIPARQRLKILQVTPDLRAGGLQRVVMDLAYGLAGLGHQVRVCSLRGHGPLEAELAGRGIEVLAMPWPERGADRFMFRKVWRLLREGGYDVAHTHNTQAFLDGGLAALLAGTPVRIHTDHARPFPDRLRYTLPERLISLAYQRVVGVSAHTAGNLREHVGIAAARLAVIPNGIDGAWYRRERDKLDRDALRRAAGLEGFTHVFGLGVRLEEQKGIRHLLEAMPHVLARYPGAGLAIAGTGSLEAGLKDLAHNLGVSKHVRFLGSFPQLTSFYPLLDVYVLPSLWEGLPLCLLEAMSLGLPIVATRVGGVGELLEHGRHALLVGPADPRALAAAMTAMLADPVRALRLGEAGQALFQSRYDGSVMVAAYLDLYRRCLGARRGRAPDGTGGI